MKSTSIETIKLSHDDVAEAIAAWLETKRPRPVGAGLWKVEVGAALRSTGFGSMEHDEPYAVITATRDLG